MTKMEIARTTINMVSMYFEMVHVKQHENDGLSLEVRAHYFRGTWYDPEDDYWFNPWEIEARGYEQAFWSMYANNWSKFV